MEGKLSSTSSSPAAEGSLQKAASTSDAIRRASSGKLSRASSTRSRAVFLSPGDTLLPSQWDCSRVAWQTWSVSSFSMSLRYTRACPGKLLPRSLMVKERKQTLRVTAAYFRDSHPAGDLEALVAAAETGAERLAKGQRQRVHLFEVHLLACIDDAGFLTVAPVIRRPDSQKVRWRGSVPRNRAG